METSTDASPAPPATTSDLNSTPPSAAINAGSQHVCFICLLNERETPAETWVNPCPCTLEAHEACMLRWVAETEQQGSRNKNGLKCPACAARIRVDEPHDTLVALRDRWHRTYSRLSPLVLLWMILSGGAVGSACYGLLSAHTFAGPRATARWLGLHEFVARPRNLPFWRNAPFWKMSIKFWALSLVAPALTIGRAIPAVRNLVLIPTSLLSGALLFARDEMPSWPPSPAWAMTMFPFLSLTYANIYYEFFGSLERRLNRALRGRPVEEPAEPRHEVAPGQAQDEQQEDGLWANLWGLGQAIAGFFVDHHEVIVEAEVRVGNAPNNNDAEINDDDAARIEAELIVLDDEEQHLGWEGDQPADHPAALPMDDGPGRRQEPGQNRGQNQEQNHAQNNIQDAAPPGEDNRVSSGLTDIINNIVTSLMYPTICWGMGNILYHTLPRSWLSRPTGWRRPPTGLLQQQWGRSLVGGCLYVVLKDAFVLYVKYRRVQVKKNRKVRNVERRK